MKKSKSGYLFWNLKTNFCFSAEEKSLKVQETDNGTRFVELETQLGRKRFFPDFSPVALKDDLTKDDTVPFRVFSRNLFEGKPHLFLFGKSAVYFSKGLKKWKIKKMDKAAVSLPWMNFKISLTKYSPDSYPVQIPWYKAPKQKSANEIIGDTKAIKLEIDNETYWVRSDAPLSITNSKQTLNFIITKKSIDLPYEITLKNFVMKTDPGTTKAASYESFVDLLDGRGTDGANEHHVFMNNPLKYDDFTFYQSSYFNISATEYGSVFSVNYDPGRPIKYLGSILLVFGSIWHFYIRRKKVKI